MSAIKFLQEKGILSEDKTQWIVRFSDGKEFDIVKLMDEHYNTLPNDKGLRIKVGYADNLMDSGLLVNV